jgi:hypothetical protein
LLGVARLPAAAEAAQVPQLAATLSSPSAADDRGASAAALVRGFGISEAQALHNVDVQAQARDIVSRLENALGVGYAGLWFDNIAGKFRVGAAPSTDQQAARTLISRLGVARDAEVVPVSSTWKIAAWTINTNYLIYGSAWSYYGESLCRQGATTARECGTDHYASLINVTLNGVGHQTYNAACASHGDSGGPFAASNMGYGITISAYLCPNAGSYYTEANAAASAMGVTVASAG